MDSDTRRERAQAIKQRALALGLPFDALESEVLAAERIEREWRAIEAAKPRPQREDDQHTDSERRFRRPDGTLYYLPIDEPKRDRGGRW